MTKSDITKMVEYEIPATIPLQRTIRQLSMNKSSSERVQEST